MTKTVKFPSQTGFWNRVNIPVITDIVKDETTWKEGSKDRRQVGGGVDKGSLGLQATGIFPKYGNYLIYGNMVILCEGQEGIALETCWDLINAIKSE